MRLVLLVLSVAANLGLTALVWQRRDASRPATIAAETTARRVKAMGSVPRAETQIWSYVTEGGDDADFIARLRAEGFPPRIVRILVHLRVRERFRARVDELTAREDEIPYWRNRFGSVAINPELRTQRRTLEREIAEMVKTLLGPEAEKLPGDPGYDQQKRLYGGIPSDKIAALEAIDRDYGELADQVRQAARGTLLAEDRERLTYLGRERRSDIEKLLTPAELEDYDRRNSSAAHDVRAQLRFLEPAEEEFLALYRLQRDFDARYGRDHLSGEQSERRRTAQPELITQVEAALGAKRFAEYQIATDGNYSGTRSFVTGIGLSPDTAASLITIQREINRRADTIRGDAALLGEQQAEQLALLRSEAERKVAAVFAAEHLDAYKRGPGAWLAKLIPGPSPRPR